MKRILWWETYQTIDIYHPPPFYTLEEYRKLCVLGKCPYSSVCGGLYRREIFNQQVFEIPREIIRGEDALINVRLAFVTTKKPIVCHRKVYYYRPNPKSVMHTSVHTVAHAVLFHEYLWASIPEKERERYLIPVVRNKLRSLANIVYDNPADTSWKNSALYLGLKTQMKAAHYRPTLRERLYLMPRGKLGRRIAWKLASLLP